MLRKLVERALAWRLAIIGLALGLAGIGAWAFMRLPIDAFPDISSTQVKVILKAPGMTPEEVESRVITPIEMEMLGIPHQAVLRSVAKYAIADITIDFADGTDIYWARTQVAERLNGVMGDLSGNVSGGMAPISTPLSDMYMFTLEGPQSLAEKRRTLDWVIRPALRTVPGVADVNSLGGRAETFEVVPNASALAAAQLTVTDLATAIEESNRNDGAGRLVSGEEALIVRATGAIRTLDDLGAIVVRSENGNVLRVSDVAQVRTGSLTRYGAVTKDGKGEAVEGLVIGLRGADAAQVVDGVKTRLEELQPSLPQGMSVSVFYDRSNLIERAVGTVEEALLEATLLVVVLLLLFLGDVRASVIVALALPMAALLTFIFMRSIGLTANLMSLGGLAIAVGMLVDGAVVVVENVVERLSDPKHAHSSKLHNVFIASAEVAKPVASGMAIIALVFLPLLTLQGLEGKLFAPVALTVVLALLSALVLSLTLVPVMAFYVLNVKADEGHHEPWLMRKVSPRYHALLNAAFGRRKLVYTVAGISLLLTGVAYSVTGKTFLPTMDEGSVIVQLTKLPSISLEHSVEGDLKVQRALLSKVPEVTEVVARVGSDELGLDPMGLNETDTFLKLKPREGWRVPDKEWLVGQLRNALVDLPGIEPSFTQPIEMRISEMLTGSRGDLAIKIFGPDLDELARIAGDIQGRLEGIKGTSEAMTVANDRVDYLQMDIDRLAAGHAGERAAGCHACASGRRPCRRRGRRHPPRSHRYSWGRAGAVAAGFRRYALPLAHRPTGPCQRCCQGYPGGGPGEAGTRERLAFRTGAGLRLRPRSGRLCRRGQGGHCIERRSTAGLPDRLGRPVREPAACLGPADGGAADLARDDLRGALRDAQFAPRFAADHRHDPLRLGRRHDLARLLRRIPLGPRFGRLHRPAGYRGAQWPRHGQLLPPAAGGRRAALRGGPSRGRAASASGADDCDDCRLRSGAAALRERTGIGNPEASGDRGDRRPRVLDAADAGAPAAPL